MPFHKNIPTIAHSLVLVCLHTQPITRRHTALFSNEHTATYWRFQELQKSDRWNVLPYLRLSRQGFTFFLSFSVFSTKLVEQMSVYWMYINSHAHNYNTFMYILEFWIWIEALLRTIEGTISVETEVCLRPLQRYFSSRTNLLF